MITVLYVPRHRVTGGMEAAREDLLQHEVDLVYGTIRLIKRDEDAFLEWAKDDYTCVIFNLRIDHHSQGLDLVRTGLLCAIDFDGSYFLTYHRYADRDQLLRCYPEFPLKPHRQAIPVG
jgi:hypothetical protein